MNKAQAIIVEDSSILAGFLATVLAEAGYEVEILDDGQAAWTRLQEVVPDLILLDLNIPGLSGEKLLAKIRQDERLTAVRILVVSGNAARAGQMQSRADMILPKPVDYHQLHRLSRAFHPDYQSTHIFPSR